MSSYEAGEDPMNRQELLESVTQDQLKSPGELADCSVGDTIDVHVRIIEGEKERIQVFQGLSLIHI